MVKQVKQNNTARMIELLKEVDIEAPFNNGYTLLTFAIKKHNLGMVEEVLKNGASPDTDDGNGNIPLMFATSEYSNTPK